MDVVGGELAVREWFEEEADGFEEVVFGVYDGGFDIAGVAVEKGGYFGEETEFVHGWLVGLAGVDVELRCFGHADTKIGDLFISHCIQVLGNVSVDMGSLESERTTSPALRRRFVGFFNAASIALSSARLRPV